MFGSFECVSIEWGQAWPELVMVRLRSLFGGGIGQFGAMLTVATRHAVSHATRGG